MRLFKRAIRKIAPLAASVLMIGAIGGGAVGADLGDFPQPFVDASGAVDVAIVIAGDVNVGPEDIIAATSIQSALVVPVSGGGGTVTIGGDAEVKDIPLGYNLNDNTYGWGSSITDSDVASLWDDEISIQVGDVSGSYDTHEEVVFAGGLAVRTGLNITSPDDDFGDRPFIEVLQKSITYRYVFDETVKSGNYLSNASTDDPITLVLMGKEVEITAASKTNGDDITALVGDKFTLAERESKVVDGKTVTLLQVGAGGAISVDVDGDSDIIPTGQTRTVGGFRVKNHARVAPGGGATTGSATLIVGSKTSDTFKTGEEFIGEDEDDPDWIWQILNLNAKDDSGKPKINVTWDQVWTDSDEVLYEGDSLTFPNGFFNIKFDSLTDGIWSDFILEKRKIELYNSSSKGKQAGTSENSWNTSAIPLLVLRNIDGRDDSIKLPSASGNIVTLGCGGKETSEIYIRAAARNVQTMGNNITIYWKDKNDGGKAKFCAITGGFKDENIVTVTLQSDDATFNFDIVPANTFDQASIPQVRFVIGRGEQQYVNLSTNVSEETGSLGFEQGFSTRSGGGTAVAANVRVVGSMGPKFKDIGTWEENTLTVDGLKIYDPDDFGDSNKFKFAIPRDENIDFRANIIVSGSGSVTTGTTGAGFTKSPEVTILDSEITTAQDMNIISIGGSAINRVSARILDLPFPTLGTDQAWQDATGVTGEGQAIIKIIDPSPYAADKIAMLVAGWTGPDTRKAGSALFRGTPDLTGKTEALLNTVSETATLL